MNRQADKQPLDRPAQSQQPMDWLAWLSSKVKWIVIAVVAFLFVSCAAPVVAGWWWWNSTADTALVSRQLHPAQVVGTIAAPITCQDDEWIVSWATANGKQYACTKQWK